MNDDPKDSSSSSRPPIPRRFHLLAHWYGPPVPKPRWPQIPHLDGIGRPTPFTSTSDSRDSAALEVAQARAYVLRWSEHLLDWKGRASIASAIANAFK